MLKIERFVNELMTSNCYLVYDDVTKQCIAVDPGSEKSEREISYIRDHQLQLEYIIITHEHTDHNWGVNSLHHVFQSSHIICSFECSKRLRNANDMYFLFYYDDQDYKYVIDSPDIIIRQDGEQLSWGCYGVKFLFTPGHSFGSMCVDIDGYIFSGDTIMPYKAYFNGRDSNRDDWVESVDRIVELYSKNTLVYPGHGDKLSLGEWYKQYR